MKNISTNPLFLITAFFVLLFIYSILGPKFPVSILSQQKGEPLIVTEEGKTTVTPDVAKINLGIQETGTSLKLVQDSVSKKSKDLVGELKRFDISEKDIKTTRYSIYPQYNYDTNPAKITGYQVDISYEVTIEDFDKVNEILTSTTALGANIVGNVAFDLSDEEKDKALQEAREEAVEKAKDKAKSLAKAAGISLGKIINISELSETEYPQPLYSTGINLEKDSEEIIRPQIEPGETEITTSITISWEIK